MRSALALPIIAVALSTAGSAVADDYLKGSYALLGIEACLQAPSGFANDSKGNPTAPNDHNSFGSMINVQGLWVFNGDGTGKVTGTFIGVVPPPPDSRSAPKEGAVTAGTYGYAFTYSRVSNNSFNWNSTPGTYQGTQTHGKSAGQQFSIDRRYGAFLISKDQKQIMSTNVGPYVENLIYPGPPARTFPRSCFYSTSGFRLE